MTVTAEIGAKQLGELIKEVEAGNEVLLTQNANPVARLVPAKRATGEVGAALRLRSLKGHRVLSASISQSELAKEMFGIPCLV